MWRREGKRKKNQAVAITEGECAHACVCACVFVRAGDEWKQEVSQVAGAWEKSRGGLTHSKRDTRREEAELRRSLVVRHPLQVKHIPS